MELKKEKKKNGCLIFIIGVIALLAILGIIGNRKNDNSINLKADGNIENIEPTSNPTDRLLADSITKARISDIDKELNNMKSIFNIRYDDMEETTWITHKNQPKYTNTKGFYTYIGIKNGVPWERLVIRYYGDDWLFIQNIKIKSDDNTYNLYPANLERDNNSSVWEWIDISPSNSDLIMLERVIGSKETKVRFEGKKYYKDWVLTNKEIKGLSDTQKYFNLLTEKSILEKQLK